MKHNPADHLGLLNKVAGQLATAMDHSRNFRGGKEELFEEFRQIGAFGLMEACDSYKEGCGYAFSTHAANCIRWKITGFIKRQLVQKRNEERLLHLHETVGNCDGEELLMIDTIKDDEIPLPDELAMQLEEEEIVKTAVSTLSSAERVVVQMRLGLDGTEKSFNEIGDAIGRTHQRAHQIYQVAMKKLVARVKTKMDGIPR